MKILVIPDIHLKTKILDKAREIMHTVSDIDNIVCLGDIFDDFGQQDNSELYKKTFDAVIDFDLEFPNTLWCYGNHDISYVWKLFQSGYSYIAEADVKQYIQEFQNQFKDRYKYVHKIDDVVFSHGGISYDFVASVVKYAKDMNNPDIVVDRINSLSKRELWETLSPLWFRPQDNKNKIYYPRKLLQVVGHTPVKKVYRSNGILSCDVFSTYRDGTPYGEQKFVLLDTQTKEWSTLI